MDADPARWLILLRHAKSAWPDVDDHERPLADRGLRDAPKAGRWLRESGHIPDQVICSTARRTRETWRLASAELDTSPPVDFDERLYDAYVEEVMDIVHATPDSVRRLLLVGHEPTASATTLTLAGDSGDSGDENVELVRSKFPTGSIAVLALPGSWAEAGPGGAALTDFFRPRFASPPMP